MLVNDVHLGAQFGVIAVDVSERHGVTGARGSRRARHAADVFVAVPRLFNLPYSIVVSSNVPSHVSRTPRNPERAGRR